MSLGFGNSPARVFAPLGILSAGKGNDTNSINKCQRFFPRSQGRKRTRTLDSLTGMATGAAAFERASVASGPLQSDTLELLSAWFQSRTDQDHHPMYALEMNKRGMSEDLIAQLDTQLSPCHHWSPVRIKGVIIFPPSGPGTLIVIRKQEGFSVDKNQVTPNETFHCSKDNKYLTIDGQGDALYVWEKGNWD